ncbi:complement component receptor 1-like protein [Bufo bufo]|uniref:complement component receptor 1-like protein n=1 Tax=Bufo bufo TaxID=8384 RepID=UPI001ABE4A35|nr:complement component receptor 1-like protein [Bufo bufo]
MMDHVVSTVSLLVIALTFCFITSVYCDCGSPPSISYGLLKEEFENQETFKAGYTVQYRCRPGFIRILGARNTVTCMSNSRWTSHEKFCTAKSCGNPGDIDNGYFEATDFLFGAKVTYHCNEGYNMISRKAHRYCQEDGTWSYDVPQCEAVICPHPASILNGIFSPERDEYTFLDTIQYRCNNPKSVLYGETFASCTEKGTWSSNPPKCIDVECPSPEVHNARKLSGFAGPYTLNSVVRFECFEGFVMNGIGEVKCNIYSQWGPSLPKCERNFCYTPQLINGRIQKGKPKNFHNEKGFLTHDSVTMECDSYFVLNGQSTITCQEDLTWHPEVPICEKRFGCSSPKIANGHVVLKNGKYYYPEEHGHAFSTSDKIQVECDDGFELVGKISSKCKLGFFEYYWSPKLPTCERW